MKGTTLSELLCCLTILWIEVEAFGPAAGPFDVKLNQLESCADEGTGQVRFGSKISAAGNGKYTYSSPFHLHVPLDENLKVYVELQEWGNGGYKPKSIEYTIKNCEEMWKLAKEFIKGLMKSTGTPVEKCPIPAGNYTADNWLVDVKITNIPVMPYKKYKAIVTMSYKGVKVGCEIAYAEIVPKGSLG